MTNDILQHHGILGMKWGVRRNLQEKRRAAARKKKNIVSNIKASKKQRISQKTELKSKLQKSKRSNGPTPAKHSSDAGIRQSVRLNEENKFMYLNTNRMLSSASRKECKQIFDNREKYSYSELQHLSRKYEEEAAISNALYQRNRKKGDIGRMVARSAVNVAFDGDARYLSNPAKALINATDKSKSTTQVEIDLLSSSLQSMSAYAKDNGLDFDDVVNEAKSRQKKRSSNALPG